MSALESLITVGGSVVGSGVLVAVVNRLQRRDALDADAARDERREETASHKREDRVLERLHDDCRKDVARLEVKCDQAIKRATEAEVSVGRCEERHRLSEEMHARRHASNEERIARLERRSNPPLTMEPAE